ncbi:hypothetical protein MMC12_006433 [Toensbergia leucococca]|nr:hypothetical protein [Toensbergia leucococca]
MSDVKKEPLGPKQEEKEKPEQEQVETKDTLRTSIRANPDAKVAGPDTSEISIVQTLPTFPTPRRHPEGLSTRLLLATATNQTQYFTKSNPIRLTLAPFLDATPATPTFPTLPTIHLTPKYPTLKTNTRRGVDRPQFLVNIIHLMRNRVIGEVDSEAMVG